MAKARRKSSSAGLASLRSAAAGARKEARKVCTVAFRVGRERQRELDADGLRREIAGCEDLTRSARALTDEYAGKRPKLSPLQLQKREQATARKRERVEFVARDAAAIVRERMPADVEDSDIWRAVQRAARKLPARERRHDRVAELALDSLRQGALDAHARQKSGRRALDRYARDAELSEAHERIARLEASLEELRGAGRRALRRAGEKIAAKTSKRAKKKPAKKARRAPESPTVIIIEDDDVPF